MSRFSAATASPKGKNVNETTRTSIDSRQGGEAKEEEDYLHQAVLAEEEEEKDADPVFHCVNVLGQVYLGGPFVWFHHVLKLFLRAVSFR